MDAPQTTLTLPDGLLRAGALNNFAEQDEWLSRYDPTWQVTTRFARELGMSDLDRMQMVALIMLARARKAEAALKKAKRPDLRELRRFLDE